ncbi:MAG: tetratricopeptide repeat protein [Leptospirales bacterium]|nr:tetratricopeptide repeat protein [Leptospirales bacterium]
MNCWQRRSNAAPALIMVAWALAAGSLQCSSSAPEAFNEEQWRSFNEAQTFYRNQKFDQAAALLEALYKERPDSVEAAVLLARCRFYTRQFDQAEKALQTFLNRDADNPYALMWLGKTLAAQDARQSEAAAIFRRILQRDPENYVAHYYLGRCLESQNELRPALAAYQSALGADYQLSRIHLHMGRLFERMNMPERSSEHYRMVRALNINARDVAAASDEGG